MPTERSEEELAGGFLKVVVGGSPRQLPTLKIRAEREWKLKLAEVVATRQTEIDLKQFAAGGDASYQALLPLANMPTDTMLELINEYDPQGKLGGTPYLEEHADSSELYAILQKILRTVYPFVSDLREIINELVKLLQIGTLARSLSSSSTNGASENGLESTSKIGSTTSS